MARISTSGGSGSNVPRREGATSPATRARTVRVEAAGDACGRSRRGSLTALAETASRPVSSWTAYSAGPSRRARRAGTSDRLGDERGSSADSGRRRSLGLDADRGIPLGAAVQATHHRGRCVSENGSAGCSRERPTRARSSSSTRISPLARGPRWRRASAPDDGVVGLGIASTRGRQPTGPTHVSRSPARRKSAPRCLRPGGASRGAGLATIAAPGPGVGAMLSHTRSS